MDNLIQKLMWTLAVILLAIAVVIALPIVIGLAGVLLPVLGVIVAVIFIPIAIGIVIGHSGKRRQIMTDDMKKTIGSLFYEDGLRKEDLIRLFKLRPKTLDKILAEVRSMFVKGS